MSDLIVEKLGARGYDFVLASLVLQRDPVSSSVLGCFVGGELPLDTPRVAVPKVLTDYHWAGMRTSLGESMRGRLLDSLMQSIGAVHSKRFPVHVYWSQILRTLGDGLGENPMLREVEGSLYLSGATLEWPWERGGGFEKVILEGVFLDREPGFVFDAAFSEGRNVREWCLESLLAVLVPACDGDVVVVAPRLEGKWFRSDFKARL